jgi:hypothetical protein
MRVLMAAILSASLIGLTPPVQAADTTPTVRQALRHVDNGTWTTADLRVIKRHPRIAAKVADPRAPEQSGSRSGSSATVERQMTRGISTVARARLGRCGYWYLAWFRKRSLLRNTMYKYYHRVDYCKTSRRITRWQHRTDFWREPDTIAYWRELVENRRRGRGTRVAYSTRMRHIAFCLVKLGCYQSFYPWVTLTIRANGRNRYRGSAG